MKILLAILVLSSLATGCKSECRALCERQLECVSLPAEQVDGSKLNREKQREVCERLCETAVDDPKKKDGMAAALECGKLACGEFESCLTEIHIER